MVAAMLDESPTMSTPVSEAFAAFAGWQRRVHFAARAAIFAAAAGDGRIGAPTETLRWGEPAYLTQATRRAARCASA